MITIKKHYSYYNPQDGKYYVDKPYSLRDDKVSPSAAPKIPLKIQPIELIKFLYSSATLLCLMLLKQDFLIV